MPQYKIIDVEGRWNEGNEDEWLWWPRVQWIDPGVTSGLSIIWFDPIALFAGQPTRRCLLAITDMYLHGPEEGVNGQANQFLRIHKALNQQPGLAVGSESFVLLSPNQSWELLSPVRIAAMIRFGLSRTHPQPWVENGALGEGVRLHMQSPSDAMSAFTNARLKSMGLFTEGPDHINDAKRHALLWIRKLAQLDRESFQALHGVEEGWWE